MQMMLYKSIPFFFLLTLYLSRKKNIYVYKKKERAGDLKLVYGLKYLQHT